MCIVRCQNAFEQMKAQSIIQHIKGFAHQTDLLKMHEANILDLVKNGFEYDMVQIMNSTLSALLFDVKSRGFSKL